VTRTASSFLAGAKSPWCTLPCACPPVGSLTYKSPSSVEELTQAHLQAHVPFTYFSYALDLRIVYTIRWFALANTALDTHGSQMLPLTERTKFPRQSITDTRSLDKTVDRQPSTVEKKFVLFVRKYRSGQDSIQKSDSGRYSLPRSLCATHQGLP
jgi:hypothetical protein